MVLVRIEESRTLDLMILVRIEKNRTLDLIYGL